MIATAWQGDTLDQLCQRHLGATAGITEVALGLNPGLAAIGPILPAGLQVILPDSASTSGSSTSSIVQLWD